MLECLTSIDNCEKEQKVLEAKREEFRAERSRLKKEREERKSAPSPSSTVKGSPPPIIATDADKTIITAD